jgi:hypothetical protein
MNTRLKELRKNKNLVVEVSRQCSGFSNRKGGYGRDVFVGLKFPQENYQEFRDLSLRFKNTIKLPSTKKVNLLLF